MKIERFGDIRAWQQARELANLVYDLTERGNFSKDFRLRDQIQSAAGSVMHNIAEGFDDGSDAEFIRFLKYARRSASEVQSEIYLALDRKYMAQKISNMFTIWQPQPRNPSTPSLPICADPNVELHNHPETIRPCDHETI